jgi:hypothetical protein
MLLLSVMLLLLPWLLAVCSPGRVTVGLMLMLMLLLLLLLLLLPGCGTYLLLWIARPCR